MSCVQKTQKLSDIGTLAAIDIFLYIDLKAYHRQQLLSAHSTVAFSERNPWI